MVCESGAEDAVFGVGVAGHVEGAVAGGHDGGVVDDVGAVSLTERAVAGAGDGAGAGTSSAGTRPALYCDPGGAEVRRAGEVGHAGA